LKPRSRHIILALVAVVALGAGGGAYATAKKQSGGAKQEQRSSKQRRSTQQQGTNQSQQFDRGDCPGGRGGPALFSGAVADYLGLTREQLANRLRNGDSLADIAKAQGKSVDGLKDVILNEATKDLNADVQAGRLTESQKNEILDDIRSNLDDIVNGQGPRFDGPPGMGPGDGQFGPPDGRFDGQFGPPGGSGSNTPSSGSQGAGYFT
jgi:hypothetical protein